MNKKDRKYFEKVRHWMIERSYRKAADTLDEWQSMEYGQSAGHTDKIFNNWGSGRSDR